MALLSIATFNANNLFLRYDFRRAYPGGEYDASARIADGDTRLGYLPGLSYGRPGDGRFVVWDDANARWVMFVTAKSTNRYGVPSVIRASIFTSTKGGPSPRRRWPGGPT